MPGSKTPGEERFQGQAKFQQAAATSVTHVTGPCRLVRVIIQTAGAGVVDFYDNTVTAGSPVASIPASAVGGSIFEFDTPMDVGLRCVVAASGPTITIVASQ